MKTIYRSVTTSGRRSGAGRIGSTTRSRRSATSGSHSFGGMLAKLGAASSRLGRARARSGR
jgi:hypothetical protein